MRVFVDSLRTCLCSAQLPDDESCHVRSDNIPDLKRFAVHIGLWVEWHQWSSSGTPHYDLTKPDPPAGRTGDERVVGTLLPPFQRIVLVPWTGLEDENHASFS